MNNRKEITIFLVDDDPGDREILQRYLEDIPDYDINLIHFTNAEKAKIELTRKSVHLIFLDYMLGSVTGVDVLREIIESGCKAPVVMLTGKGDETVAVNSLKAGAIDYLIKSNLNSSLLARSIRYALKQVNILNELEKSREVEHFLATHDTLTKLPNRQLFMDTLKQSIKHSHRHNCLIGILYIDVDRFKSINDVFGHIVGDYLLVEIADRLSNCLREADIIARLGGDEFSIILQCIKDIKETEIVAQKIIIAMARPFFIKNQNFNISISMGISIYPTDAENIDTLIYNADLAMYQIKKHRSCSYEFYSKVINSRILGAQNLKEDVCKALQNNELKIHYQSIVDAETSDIVGMEALVRFNHPEMGIVLPNKFIPILEQKGGIIPLDGWVLRTACMQYVKWEKEGLPQLQLSVNVSALHFKQHNIVQIISQLLKDTGMDGNCLNLEITEVSLMQDIKHTTSTLLAIKDMGCHIAIDDFGSGFSSLSYLKNYPIDTLKIDKSFICNMLKSNKDAALTITMIDMAHSLDMKVVGEGVEDENQLNFLKKHGCDYIQGFLFSRPIPAIDFMKLFKSKV